MAILEAVITQRCFGQLAINRYHYVSSGVPAAVTPTFGLLHAMGYLPSRITGGVFPNATLAGQVQALQGVGVETVSAYARDLYSVSDFYEAPFPTPPVGQKGGETMSPVIAYGLYSSRVRTDIRRGMKRYVGVAETMVNAGGSLHADIIAVLNNVAASIAATLTYDDEGNTITYVPCVLGLEKYTTPAGNVAYRPYATQAAQLTHVAQGGTWSPYTQVRTQVSRQYGRGA